MFVLQSCAFRNSKHVRHRFVYQCFTQISVNKGPIRLLRSDRGTNFVGATREFREAVGEMDTSRVTRFLQNKGCDFQFKMNVPSASHMGGVWERQIRSVRSILNTLLDQSGTQLDDESLRTFMCEAASIINSRPLTVDNLNDPQSPEPLTPNHLLTRSQKSYCHLQVNFSNRTCIHARGGAECSILPIRFGLVGKGSSFKTCKGETSGLAQVATCVWEISSS